jgi:hypothetical protein
MDSHRIAHGATLLNECGLSSSAVFANPTTHERVSGTVNTGDAGGEMTAELRELAV